MSEEITVLKREKFAGESFYQVWYDLNNCTSKYLDIVLNGEYGVLYDIETDNPIEYQYETGEYITCDAERLALEDILSRGGKR